MMSKRKRFEPGNLARSTRDVQTYHRESDTFSKLDEGTLSYYKEIRLHFDELTDEEQRSILAASALEETKGKEAEVAGDKVCSRVLEVLLAAAPPEAVEQFAAGALADDTFISLASSPNGSHVAERLLETLVASGTDRSHEILLAASKVIADKLYEFATDRFGSHVARRIIALAGGVDGQGSSGAGFGGERSGGAQAQQAKGLAAKVGLQNSNSKADSGGPARDEQLLMPISASLLADGFAQILAEELPYHQYGGAFLQTVLQANKGNTPFLAEIIPRIFGVAAGCEPGGQFAAVSSEDFHAMLQERTSSHLMEVIASVAPEDMREQMYERFYKNHLAYLAMHPVANFVVQAMLAAINKSPQIKAVIKELRGSFPTLLRSKRGGVVAAVLAAAGRTSTGQVDTGKALAAALRELPGNQQGLAAALLTLDLGSKLEGLDTRKRLSPLGCTMLISLFSYIKEASTEYLDSLLELAPKDLARVAADPGGSRVLEALIEGPCAAKLKKKLLKKVQGYYATAAATPGGNFLVEKCYAHAGLKEKEIIAEELAKAEAQLSATPRGMKLLLRCRVAEFKKSSAKWRNQVQAADALKQEFADIIADALPAAQEGDTEAVVSRAGKPKKKRKREQASTPAEGIGEAVAAMPTKSQDLVASKALGSKIEAAGAELPPKKEKKKRKKQQADVGADMLGADSNGSTRKASETAEDPPRKKKRKPKVAKDVQDDLAAEPAQQGNFDKIGSQTAQGIRADFEGKGRDLEGGGTQEDLPSGPIAGSADDVPSKQKKRKKKAKGEDVGVVPQFPAAGEQNLKQSKRKKAGKARPTKESNQAAVVPEATEGSSLANLTAPATDQAAPSILEEKQHLKPSGLSEAASDVLAGVARPHVGPEGDERGLGKAGAPVMESQTVDGILTSLEVFEDKSPRPSALIRPGSSLKGKNKVRSGQKKPAQKGQKRRGGELNNTGKSKMKADDGRKGKSKKSSRT